MGGGGGGADTERSRGIAGGVRARNNKTRQENTRQVLLYSPSALRLVL